MATGGSRHRRLSPLLKELRLWDRRARRGVLPPADRLPEWDARIAEAGSSSEAGELTERIESIRRALGLAGAAISAMAPAHGQPADGDGSGLVPWQGLDRLIDERRRLPLAGANVLGQEFGFAAVRSSDFSNALASRANAFLSALAGIALQASSADGYQLPDMPLAFETELQLDWVDQETDPWQQIDAIARARATVESLAKRGVRVKLVRGRPVPTAHYQPVTAQPSAAFSVPGPRGPVPLDRLEVIDQATLVAQRPGRLQVVVPPARYRPPRPEDAAAPPSWTASSGALVSSSRSGGDQGLPAETFRGDPGQASLPTRAIPGLPLTSRQQRPAISFASGIASAVSPVRASSAGQADLVTPGRFIASAATDSIAPVHAPIATALPLPLSRSQGSATTPAPGPTLPPLPPPAIMRAIDPRVAREETTRRIGVGRPPIHRSLLDVEPVKVQPATGESATVRIALSWVDGADPWQRPGLIERARESLRQLEARGVRVEVVRGHAVAAHLYLSDPGQPTSTYGLLGPGGPVFLDSVDRLDQAVVPGRRSGTLQVVLSPEAVTGHRSNPAGSLGPVGATPYGPSLALPLVPVDERDETAVPSGTTAQPTMSNPVGSIPRVPGRWSASSASPRAPTSASVAVRFDAVTPLSSPHRPVGLASAQTVVPSNLGIGRRSSASRPRPTAASTANAAVPGVPRQSKTVRLALDWVTGDDLESQSDFQVQARQISQTLAERGIHVEIVRGRSVTPSRYDPVQGRSTTAFSLPSPSGPVPLTGLDVLERANLIAARPGFLRLLVAPARFRREARSTRIRDTRTPTGRDTISLPSVGAFDDEDTAVQPDERRAVGTSSRWSSRSLVDSSPEQRASIANLPTTGPPVVPPWMGERGFPPRPRGVPGRGLSGVNPEVMGSALEPEPWTPGRWPSRGITPIASTITPLSLFGNGEGQAGEARLVTEQEGWGRALSLPLALPLVSLAMDDAVESANPPERLTTRIGIRPTSGDRGSSVVRERWIPRAAQSVSATALGAALSAPPSISAPGRPVAPLASSRAQNAETAPAPGARASRAGETPGTGGRDARAPGRSATSSVASPAAGGSETVRLSLDWVAGSDPWQRPEIIERARETVRDLEARGVRVEIVRGHAVAAHRYDARQGLPAASFVVPLATGAVSLEQLDILDQAVLVAQRPGGLRALVAPAAVQPPNATTDGAAPRPPIGELASGPALTFAVPELLAEAEPDFDTSEQRSRTRRSPRTDARRPLSRPERVRVVLDWVAGEDPWRQGSLPLVQPEIERRLARQGVRLELVRGREVPAAAYEQFRTQDSGGLVLNGPRGAVSLDVIGFLAGAVPVARRPGQLQVILGRPARAPSTTQSVPLPLAPPFDAVTAGTPSLAASAALVRESAFWSTEGEWGTSPLTPPLRLPVRPRPAERASLVAGTRFAPGIGSAGTSSRESNRLTVGSSTTALSTSSPPLRATASGAASIDQAPVVHPPNFPTRSLPSPVAPTTTQAMVQGVVQRLSAGTAGPGERSTNEEDHFAFATEAVIGSPRIRDSFAVGQSQARGQIAPRDSDLTGSRGRIGWTLGSRVSAESTEAQGAAATPTPLNVLVFDVPGAESGPATVPAMRPPETARPTVRSTVTRIASGRRGSPAPATGTTVPMPTFVFARDNASPSLPLRQQDVARVEEGRGPVSHPSTGPSATTSVDAGSAGAEGPKPPDLDQLARQVYAMLKQRLAVERERLGRPRGLRTW